MTQLESFSPSEGANELLLLSRFLVHSCFPVTSLTVISVPLLASYSHFHTFLMLKNLSYQQGRYCLGGTLFIFHELA